jgi:beta-glucosidase
MEGGPAVARALVGDVNPSGKLPVTFPKRVEDTPAYLHYPGGRQVLYGEGVFVGYRYYDMRKMDPLFPFGHGLSYTAFAYRNLRAPKRVKRGQSVRVTVDVTNTGIVAGCEVVQLYVADVKAVVLRPVKELKAFAKVHLAPGQRKTVELFLDERSFSFYDPHVRRDWVAEDGAFELLVGSSSRDIRARRAVELVA